MQHMAEALKRIAGVAVILMGASCIGSDSTPCGDQVCPKGWTCADVAGDQTCVLPIQLTICSDQGLAEGDICDNGDAQGYHCHGEICIKGECGDGVRDSTEECDDGEAGNSDTTPDACRSSCHRARCGDGVVDPSRGEQCDCGSGVGTLPDGCLQPNSDTAPDACREICTEPRCGDGVVDDGELCDDGNVDPDDGCSHDCLSAEGCGNGYVDLFLGEQCDDGNTESGDGCGPSCQVETCGNGVVDPGELCDDGNLYSGDGCSGDCLSDETCPNGYVDYAMGEQCDDDNAVSGDGCQQDCLAPVCGDSVIDPWEECDDGNATSGDGCSDLCHPEAGFSCMAGAPSVCSPTCGDGHVAGASNGEPCDDGNLLGGDGCSGQCAVEAGWQCTNDPGQPSSCGALACADGIAAGVEDCDGADLRGNGCYELGFASGTVSCLGDCTYDVSLCESVCGNGVVEPGETCDDGNSAADDGCSDHCQTEPFYACWDEPSSCICVVHVKPQAAGAQDGSTWADATSIPQGGIDSAMNRAVVLGSCEVWVAGGRYHIYQSAPEDTLQMRYGVPLYGGFSGTETARDQRDWTLHETILDGQEEGGTARVYHVVTAADQMLIDGFTITHGNAVGAVATDDYVGSGIKAMSVFFTIRNTRFEDNTGIVGGGIYTRYGGGLIEDCVFSNNTTTGRAAAINARENNVEIVRTTFVGNTSLITGAIFGSNAALTVVDCIFQGNSTTDVNGSGGGAISAYYGGVDVENTLFIDNSSAWDGGAIRLWNGATTTVSNCTFANNSASNAGGAIMAEGSLLTARNSIFHGNTAWPGPQIYEWNVTVAVTHSNVQGGWSGAGNISQDPLFVNPAGGDYHLQTGSPCIDTGDDASATTTDLEGMTRVDATGLGNPGTSADMGAYEYQP